jgi:hypothetical protein
LASAGKRKKNKIKTAAEKSTNASSPWRILREEYTYFLLQKEKEKEKGKMGGGDQNKNKNKKKTWNLVHWANQEGVRSGTPWGEGLTTPQQHKETHSEALSKATRGNVMKGPGVSVTLLSGQKHDTPVGLVETNRVYLLGVHPCPVFAVTPTLLIESSHPPPMRFVCPSNSPSYM